MHSAKRVQAIIASLILAAWPAASAGADAPALYRVNKPGLSSSAKADTKAMLATLVVKYVDGDTIKVRIARPPRGLRKLETVRLIGVDAPETVHPGKKVERFGREAGDYTRRRLAGKRVRLAFDRDLRDRYGRLLAYVYLPDGACHNAELVRHGYGHAYTRYPFQFIEEFRRLEKQARQAKKGLWN